MDYVGLLVCVIAAIIIRRGLRLCAGIITLAIVLLSLAALPIAACFVSIVMIVAANWQHLLKSSLVAAIIWLSIMSMLRTILSTNQPHLHLITIGAPTVAALLAFCVVACGGLDWLQSIVFGRS